MKRNVPAFLLDWSKQRVKRLLGAAGVPFNARTMLAARFLQGSGIEVGALHDPLILPRKAMVKYVDRMPKGQLYEQYPELVNMELVDVDIVDDAETLRSIGDGTLDFLIANHFLEHVEGTFRTIENLLRVVCAGGCLCLTIPDMRFTFDRRRTPTSLEHLIRDYEEGPAWSRDAHFDEWVRLVNGLEAEQAVSEKRRLQEMNYSIHYHAWTAADMVDFFSHFNRSHNRPYQVECIERSRGEVITVLRKT